MTDDTTNPNGLAFNRDEVTLYIAQSEYTAGNPWAFRAQPIPDSGLLVDYRVLHDFRPHRVAGGMCLTEDGELVVWAGWEESEPGRLIYVFGPSVCMLATHSYPGSAPTNCCFGGADLNRFPVTVIDDCLRRASADRSGRSLPPGGGDPTGGPGVWGATNVEIDRAGKTRYSEATSFI